jgi:hypothetical protein
MDHYLKFEKEITKYYNNNNNNNIETPNMTKFNIHISFTITVAEIFKPWNKDLKYILYNKK